MRKRDVFLTVWCGLAFFAVVIQQLEKISTETFNILYGGLVSAVLWYIIFKAVFWLYDKFTNKGSKEEAT